MLPVSYYDRNKSGRIVSYIVNDITQINKSLTNTLSNLIMEPLLLCFFWGMLLVINFKLTIIIMVVYPLFFYVIAKIGSSVKRRSRRMLENFSGMMGVLTETIQGVRLVKMFNMNAVETDKFSLENRKFIRSSYKSEKAKALLLPLTETLAMYFTAGLLWFGGSMALAQSSRFTPGDFIRFLVFLFSSYQPIKRLGTINNTLQEGIAAAERVFTLMRVQPEKLHATGTAKTPSFERELRFENVSFKYPGCKDFVLQNIDFTVPKGMVIAIVGSSGAGKSTILDLLPRFYDVTQGAITIDGKNIRDMHLVDLRNLFGIVSQETILFNDTVKNNISYGTVEASMEAIVEAAAAANAMEFIEKLPERIDTIIGEQGVMLSGGQRQRLSIARALLRNPRILILDEATSSLDTESERLVQAAIDALIRNRTTFVVAHRLSTIRHADMIIVLDGGKIVEQGSHEELIAMNKRYKYFYDIQFASK
jgi:subfamily B ATP-binding cassette protein MsbA